MKYFKMKNEIEELKRQNLISIKKSLKLERENEELKKEIKRSKEEIKALEKKQKESNVISISMNKEDVDSIVKKVTENILGKAKPQQGVQGCPVGAVGKNGLTKEEIVGSKGLEKSIASILNGEEHKCTPECFERHVLKPIQSDIYKKFGYNSVTRSYNLIEMVKFVETWRIKLIKEYSFLKDLYTRDFGELTAVYK